MRQLESLRFASASRWPPSVAQCKAVRGPASRSSDRRLHPPPACGRRVGGSDLLFGGGRGGRGGEGGGGGEVHFFGWRTWKLDLKLVVLAEVEKFKALWRRF